MSISTADITTCVEAYLAGHPGERGRLAPLLDTLAAAGSDEDLTSRTRYAGHVTCGAVLFGARRRVLYLHHNRLRRWLLPGGHVEPGDATLRDTALREVAEETGIGADLLSPLAGYQGTPFDVDVHAIPPTPGGDEPAHWHYDLRFAFQVAGTPDVRLPAGEVSRFDWLMPRAVPHPRIRTKLLTRPQGR